ncbi:MAG: ferrous iron transport protein B [Clostridiales bacterium]|jgi:ferrous iron transport protein B|nr:ferrous iron transport protein B [Clostridiales bacterium]
MPITIALAGNPNSGKTTIFNDLTDSRQFVGNWPGVTVEKKDGRLKTDKNVTIQDLPGIYSLTAYSPEETITRRYLINEKPDAVINVVDASNLERGLYLTTQVLETGLPVVVALNMTDVARKRGNRIDKKKLSAIFGCGFIETSAVRGEGMDEIAAAAEKLAGSRPIPKRIFSGEIENAVSRLSEIVMGRVPPGTGRWHAIKLIEGDAPVLGRADLGESAAAWLTGFRRRLEETRGDTAESVIISERYAFIERAVKEAAVRPNAGRVTESDKIDAIVTNRLLALPIFAAVMFLVYYISIGTIGGFLTEWVGGTLFGGLIPAWAAGLLKSMNVAPWLISLIVDGIIAGVGGVLGFLPQMAILFACLAAMEDCGYMARIAFIMDRAFRKIGLSGKSFIPILIGTGCGVPGIMASRAIESEPERRLTVITTTFIPCGAKLPVISLIASALFGGAAWVAASAYFLGMAAIIVSGLILRRAPVFAGDSAAFVMELPAYHTPRLSNVLRRMWDRTRAFAAKAGTVILLASVVIWFLSGFDTRLRVTGDAGASILAAIGGAVAPVFAPLGWGDWRPVTASISGLIAKENAVGTLGVLFGFTGEGGWETLRSSFTPASAYSFLIFNLLCAPCAAAMAAIAREMRSARWTAFALIYQTIFAYAAALIFYQTAVIFAK